jgi:hypothetical protein
MPTRPPITVLPSRQLRMPGAAARRRWPCSGWPTPRCSPATRVAPRPGRRRAWPWPAHPPTGSSWPRCCSSSAGRPATPGTTNGPRPSAGSRWACSRPWATQPSTPRRCSYWGLSRYTRVTTSGRRLSSRAPWASAAPAVTSTPRRGTWAGSGRPCSIWVICRGRGPCWRTAWSSPASSTIAGAWPCRSPCSPTSTWPTATRSGPRPCWARRQWSSRRPATWSTCRGAWRASPRWRRPSTGTSGPRS